MAIEMNDGNRPIASIDASQQRQGNGMITPKRDDSRKGLAVLGRTCFIRCRCRLTSQDGVVSLFDLTKGVFIIIPSLCIQSPQHARFLILDRPWCIDSRRHRDISTVQNFGPAIERVRVQRNIVAAAETHFS